MRWLADENIARQAIAYPRSRGEDVVSVSEVSPNIADRAVVELAWLDDRILLSFDRDHGELIFRHGAVPPRSVVYLRLEPPAFFALGGLMTDPVREGAIQSVWRKAPRL